MNAVVILGAVALVSLVLAELLCRFGDALADASRKAHETPPNVIPFRPRTTAAPKRAAK